MEPRIGGIEGGQSGFIEQDSRQPLREVRDFFVPENLYQVTHEVDMSAAPTPQALRAVGGTALRGTPTKKEIRNPHQIWDGHEFPTDNWF